MYDNEIIDYTLKLIIVGNTSVGKTTYFNIIQNNKAYFAGSTIGVDFTKMYYTINNKHVKVIVWDTAGQERYNSIVRNYFRDTCGIILMFDVSNPDTCNQLEDRLKMLVYDNKCSHEHPILLLGNKSDLQNRINMDEIDRLIQEYKVIYREISCKTDVQHHLEEIFKSFIGKIIDGDHVEDCCGIKGAVDNSRYITLNKKYNEISKSKKCCNIV
jgi:small GTP-binding protein